jgi:hypothetical protein
MPTSNTQVIWNAIKVQWLTSPKRSDRNHVGQPLNKMKQSIVLTIILF